MAPLERKNHIIRRICFNNNGLHDHHEAYDQPWSTQSVHEEKLRPSQPAQVNVDQLLDCPWSSGPWLELLVVMLATCSCIGGHTTYFKLITDVPAQMVLTTFSLDPQVLRQATTRLQTAMLVAIPPAFSPSLASHMCLSYSLRPVVAAQQV